MHHVLRTFAFIIVLLFSVVCNCKHFETDHKNPSQICLTKILQRHMGSMGTTFRVIVENSTDFETAQLQDGIFEILNDQSKWLLEIGEIGTRQFEFVSAQSKSNLMITQVLMLLGAVETFDEKIDDLLLNQRIYRGFKFVVLLLYADATNFDGIAKNLLEIAWDRKLFSTSIITQTNLTGEWFVYDTDFVRNTHKTKRCIENIFSKISLSCSNRTIREKSFYTPRHLRKACIVDVVSFEYPPFVVNETAGFEIEMLQILGEHININFNLLIEGNGDSNWGELNKSDGIWSGRLGQVEERSAVAVGNLRAMPELQRYFDFSESYYYDKMVWVVPVAELAPRWMCIFMPFSRQLWLFVVFIFVAGGVLIWLSHTKNERRIYRKLNRTLFVSLETFLAGGSKKPPKTRITRAIFISLSFSSIFFYSVYQGSLIDVLTHPIYQHQIHTLEEIIETRLQIGGFKDYRQYFNVTNDEPSMKIYNMFQTKPNSNVYDWLQTVANDRNVATISSQLYVKYLIASGDAAVVENGLPKVFVLQEVVVPITTSILMPRGFPLTERINRGIEDIIGSGVALELSKKTKSTLKKYESRKEVIFRGRQVSPLTIDNLQGVFVLLLLGSSCAMVVFSLELVVYRSNLWSKWLMVYKWGVKMKKWLSGKRFSKSRKYT